MVSKVVILAAVAFAPVVQAFTPGQLQGVWYCENDGAGELVHLPFDAGRGYPTPVANEWLDVPDDEYRTFYFEKPEAGKKTLLTGSMFRDWHPSPSNSEGGALAAASDLSRRHDRFAFKGTIVSATQAELFLNFNHVTTSSIDFNPKPGPTPAGDNNPFTPFRPNWEASGPGQSGLMAGPYTIYQVDADHFTLDVYQHDHTGSNCQAAPAACDQATCTCQGGDGSRVTVVSTEKCVRGLPISDETCAFINTDDATYLEGTEADRICRGNLMCVDNTGSEQRKFGSCGSVKCCSAQTVPVGPANYYRPPTYYQPSYNPYYQSASYRPTWG